MALGIMDMGVGLGRMPTRRRVHRTRNEKGNNIQIPTLRMLMNNFLISKQSSKLTSQKKNTGLLVIQGPKTLRKQEQFNISEAC
jgi:hypothetical protein